MASHVLCDCWALVAVNFRYPGQHLLKPGDIVNISIRRRLLNVQAEGLHKRSIMGKVHDTVFYSIPCYSLVTLMLLYLRAANK